MIQKTSVKENFYASRGEHQNCLKIVFCLAVPKTSYGNASVCQRKSSWIRGRRKYQKGLSNFFVSECPSISYGNRLVCKS